MSLEDTQWINQLLDSYQSLLTSKQQDILTLYYREDLSLREIAEQLAISHSAVSDHLKRGRALLFNYESQLKIVENEQKRRKVYDRIVQLGITEVNELIKELED